jgi:hypothetical protein
MPFISPVIYSTRSESNKASAATANDAVCLWGSIDLAPTVEAAQVDATINSLREAVAFCAKTETPRRGQQTPSQNVLAPAIRLNLEPEKLTGV